MTSCTRSSSTLKTGAKTKTDTVTSFPPSKARPEFLNDTEAKLWSRFFCLSVNVTMYLNDHSRAEFYESIGLDTTKFNMHVIHQTNKTTAQIFPQVIDTYNPKFKEPLDKLVVINTA